MMSEICNLLVVLCVGILTTGRHITEAKVFQATSLINGTVVCSIDEPTVVVGFDQLPLLSSDNNTCIPYAAQCALQCTLDDNCTNFNCREDLGRCELFHYTPTKCAVMPGCNHSQIKDLRSCREQAGFFPVCMENTTLTGSIDDNTGSALLHGQYARLTCNVTYTLSGSFSPTIHWKDYNGNVVNNATNVIEDGRLISSIFIPGYAPLLKQFTCTVSDMFSPVDYYNCTTNNVSVVCPVDFEYLPGAGCYLLIPEGLDWTTATQRCQEYYVGSHLVVINSTDEQNAIASYLTSRFINDTSGACILSGWSAGRMVWISAQRQNTSDCGSIFAWKPMAGKEFPVTYNNWMNGEPNCGGGYEMCAHVWSGVNYEWNDVACGIAMCPFCQYNPL